MTTHTTRRNKVRSSIAVFHHTGTEWINAALKFAEVAARHAHIVQLARKEAADPQLVLPLGGEQVLP